LAVNPLSLSLKPLFGQVTTHKQFERPPPPPPKKNKKRRRFLTIKRSAIKTKGFVAWKKGRRK
jgi:hypothetical protein